MDSFLTTLKKLGFESTQDFFALVASRDLTTIQAQNDFMQWKLNDGTKKGLLEIPAIPSNKEK